MMKHVLIAGSALAVVMMTGCAEFMEHEHEGEQKCDPAVVTKFDGSWRAERLVFKDGKAVESQIGNASCERIGTNVRILSPELKMELLFGLRQDGKYALIDVNTARSHMLVGKFTDEEENDDDDDVRETNDDINFKFGKKLYGEIKFASPDSIEIQYFNLDDEKEIPFETIRLNRVR